MLGKLGQVLNKDVGSLVKDAGKMLNADVGDIVKGAGKVLKTDLGELLRDAPAAAAPPSGATAALSPPPAAALPEVGITREAAEAKAAAAPKFDPDATIQLNTSPLAAVPPPPPAVAPTASLASASGTAPAYTLNDETVTRSRRPMPKGTGLATLLPHAVGDFTRPQASPTGELTSDPVTAIYGVGGETVVVKLVLCWDADEARERLDELQSQAGDNVRVAADRSWVLGQTPQGITFAWTRDTYSFSVSAPKGLGPLTRFLWAFPF